MSFFKVDFLFNKSCLVFDQIMRHSSNVRFFCWHRIFMYEENSNVSFLEKTTHDIRAYWYNSIVFFFAKYLIAYLIFIFILENMEQIDLKAGESNIIIFDNKNTLNFIV